MWSPPPSLITRGALKGVPQHGIGRSCKAGKEEIVGLLTALELFLGEADEVRHARWLAILENIVRPLAALSSVTLNIEGRDDMGVVPALVIHCRGEKTAATRIIKQLIDGSPSIHADPFWRGDNRIVFNPACLKAEDAPAIASRLQAVLGA
jgi:L-seryl-tRNA(Ser) seleniumtransferase